MKSRDALRAEGEALRTALFGDGPAALAHPAAGFGTLMAELAYGGVWARPGLSQQDRMACTLAALCAVKSWTPLRRHIGAALHIGLSPQTILEILIQDGIYCGFATSETALELALEVFAERGIAPPAAPPATDTLATMMAKGREVQAALHAERRDAGHAAPDNPVTGSIYPHIVQYCYGEIWGRPGPERRLRALCAVAAFTALDHNTLLRKFALSALNVGATREAVVEAVIQTGPYSGFAFTLRGLSAVGEEFAALPPA